MSNSNGLALGVYWWKHEEVYPEWKIPNLAQHQCFFWEGCHPDLWCAIKMKLEPSVLYSGHLEIKNIMLLFCLCDIVHKDAIWLLKPFALYLKAKADNSNKSLSLSLWFVILNHCWLSWPFFALVHLERLTCQRLPPHPGFPFPFCFLGVWRAFVLSCLMTSKPDAVWKGKSGCLIFHNSTVCCL